MKSASKYREQAWKSLNNNWGYMILASLINSLSGAFPLVLAGPFSHGMATMSLDIVRGKKASIERMFSGFYNFVNAMLLGMLIIVFTALWTMLFIIPGIVMSYAYSMSYYIMNDDPTIAPEAARKKSIEMMRGYKGKLFRLQLSFIGWILLCILTFGVLTIIVSPYMETSMAAFYEDLKAERGENKADSTETTGAGAIFPEIDDNAERAMTDEKYCDVCGTVNPSVAHYCKKCGNLLPEQKSVNMKNCPVCGKENIADAKFCKHCGSSMIAATRPPEQPAAFNKICPTCGYENVSHAKFCKFCGASMSASPSAPPVAPIADDEPEIMPELTPIEPSAQLFEQPQTEPEPIAAQAAPAETSPTVDDKPNSADASGLKLCPLCGKPNNASSKFCSKCGSDLAGVEAVKDPTAKKRGGEKHKEAKLDPVCPLCGKENIPGAKFCNKCGTKLAPAVEEQTNVCPTCGGERSSVDVYCKYCGQRLK